MRAAVLGNGAWGSALAGVCARRGHAVKVWGVPARPEEAQTLEEALDGVEMVLFAVPSHVMREVCGRARPSLPPDALLVSATKGIEEDTDLRMSEVIAETTGRKEIAVVSGPSFAAEVARGAPTAVVCASAAARVARAAQAALGGGHFRIYTSEDVVGVELGGSLKNVIAVAAGACAGLGLGDNSRAALITRGIAELSRVGTALGGQPRTFFGLSGMGDLILTCSSIQSRNYQVGEALGRGGTLAQATAALKGVAEGVRTARSIHQMIEKRSLEAPILEAVHAVLHEGRPAKEALRELMSREPKPEFLMDSWRP
ncbi:MAG: NAD(P)-dependent glycerol-3-phosphate dehydrogenase [Verrucomicrobiae bacterium]|nr:NAD(P)-dependent glycerol-3-phosphate dehydrogenase [Verrucomicrobiae bacterium]